MVWSEHRHHAAIVRPGNLRLSKRDWIRRRVSKGKKTILPTFENGNMQSIVDHEREVLRRLEAVDSKELEKQPEFTGAQTPRPRSVINRLLFGDAQEMAIDLGTANTRILIPGKGIVLDEPSIIAVEIKNGVKRLNAVGIDVAPVLGRRPEFIETVRPMLEGTVAELDATELMMGHFIQKARGRRGLWPLLSIVASAPAAATQVARRAILDAMYRASGVRTHKAWLVDGPMAAAIGAGRPLTDSVTSMVIDIGAGKTELSILDARGVGYSTSLWAGGYAMDDAVISHIRNHHGLQVGAATAERIKKQVGTAKPPRDGVGQTLRIRGRDVKTSVPREIALTQFEVAQALTEVISRIIDAARVALQTAMPEHSADIVDLGILLTGGGALLRGLDEVLQEETGIPVTTAVDPLNCTVRGMGRVIDDPAFHTLLFER
jgi:rod shape-determining protein MreB and related proteins